MQYFSHHNCHLIKFIIFWYYRPSLPFLNRLSKNQRSWAAHVAPLLYGLSFTSGHTWQNFMHQQSFQYYTRQMILHPVKCFFNDAWNGKFFLESKVPKPAGSRGSRILSNIPHRFRILEKRYAKKTCQIVARELWPLKCLQPFGCLYWQRGETSAIQHQCHVSIESTCDAKSEHLSDNGEKTPNQTRLGRRRRRFFWCFTLKIPFETVFLSKPTKKKIACGAQKNNILFW